MARGKMNRRGMDSDEWREGREATRRYRVTGHEAPLKVRDPLTGGETRYDKDDEFGHDDWPVPHVSIPNALKRGLIEEVE